MADTLPNPFREEIKGIATESGVPLGKKTNVSLFSKPLWTIVTTN